MLQGYDQVSSMTRYSFRARSFTAFQYKRAPFKVAAFFSWIVVLSSHEHIEELRRAPDDTVSLDKAAADASLSFSTAINSC